MSGKKTQKNSVEVGQGYFDKNFKKTYTDNRDLE